ncbi:hypothetical protein LUS60_03735 [Raoultella planticola]|nr:hypothetical protein [Raoultella planticola]MCD9604408.1 hypothetical protein [Raoultella planticola]
MKADWVDEAQEVTQLMVDSQVERIRSSLMCVECQTIAEFRRRVGYGGHDES